MIGALTGILVILVAMCGGMLLVSMLPVVFLSALMNRREQRTELLISGTMMLGLLLGGILSWNLFALYWDMPFWSTVRAAFDAETYGQAVEHAAENVLIWVQFFSVLSAIMAGGAAGIAARLRIRARGTAIAQT